MELGFLTVSFLDSPERKEKDLLFLILQTLNNKGHTLLSILTDMLDFLFCKIYAEFISTFISLLHSVGIKSDRCSLHFKQIILFTVEISRCRDT